MSLDSEKSALLGQMAALANFMYVDGRDAYKVLPDRAQDELRIAFDALNDELQLLMEPDRSVQEGRHHE